jgi:aspartate/methionine/tyrosine aminotransferase
MDCTEELNGHLAVYARNRSVLLDGLAQAGLTRIAPADGAFYVYADVSHITDDALALSQEILAEAGVAVTPGLDFDPHTGHHWLRFSYAQGAAAIAEGTARLVSFFEARRLSVS